MFVLKPLQICPLKDSCSLSKNCYGATEHINDFICGYLEVDKGQIKLNLPEQLRSNPNLTILHG